MLFLVVGEMGMMGSKDVNIRTRNQDAAEKENEDDGKTSISIT